MIKVKREYNHSTREYFLGTKIICKTNKPNRWYSNSRHGIYKMSWNDPLDSVLGPTCLSAWSK